MENTSTNKRNGVTVNLTDVELIELDETRGVMTRSAFARTCIIAQIKRMKKNQERC